MKKLFYLHTLFFLSSILFVPDVVFGAPSCLTEVGRNTWLVGDPSCYTTSSTWVSCGSYHLSSTPDLCDSDFPWLPTSYVTAVASCSTCASGSCRTNQNYVDSCGHGHCINSGPVPDPTGYNDVSNSCHYISGGSYGACSNGLQSLDPTTITWDTSSNTTCSNVVENTKTCCDPVTASSLTASVNPVTQKSSFNLAWSFSITPFYLDQYVCTLTVPNPAGFSNLLPTTVVKSASEVTILSGNLSDTINILANGSNASTQYTYTLNCNPVVGSVCLATSNTVNLTVTALPFKMTVTPDSGNYEIGATVPWKAEAEGGYPPYSGVWSGSVVRTDIPLPFGYFSTFDKRYGVTGAKTVTFTGSDSDSTTLDSVDTGQVTIQDSRIPQ